MKYTGSCHCRQVRFEVQTDEPIKDVISCNCSMCSKRGSLLKFVPATQFTLLSGADALTDYQFNRRIIHHTFCSTCGILPFASGVGPDGVETRAINVRCLDDVDLDEFNAVEFDGKSL